MKQHSVTSASSASRWIACPPSAKLCADAPDEYSAFAAEGTDAHTLCEYKLLRMLGENRSDPTENLTYYDTQMEECADAYAQYIGELLKGIKETCPDPVVMVEQRLDFSCWVEGGFGTGDCVIVADGTLYVIDFKYGQGVLVKAKNNPQMMCYALGALNLFDDIYDIETISMTIFQPRKENVSESTITKADLLKWADDVLVPAARLAVKGEGEFCAGEHCRFCKVKATCRKRAEYNLVLARYDFKPPATLEDAEVEAVLAKADSLVSWVSDVKEYALSAALSGKEWTGWKVVEGRSNRRYMDDTIAAEKVSAAGYDPYEHKVLGVTAMTKMLGKAKFEELLGALIEKPRGKPTLVPSGDKRKAINSAIYDFKEEQ